MKRRDLGCADGVILGGLAIGMLCLIVTDSATYFGAAD